MRIKYFLNISCLLMTFFFVFSVGAFADVVEYRVSTGNDDAEELISDGDMYRNSSDLEFADDSDFAGGLQIIGMRFQGVNIPQGATINSAYIEFKADGSHNKNTRLVIYGEDTGDANTFGNSDYDISSRSKVSTSVNWSPANWSNNSLYQTPDLSGVIKDIVDRGDWSSGNDVAIIVEPDNACNNSNCRRRAESYEGQSSRAPLLVIDYTDSFPSVTSAGGSCGTDNLIVVQYASVVDDTALDPNIYSLSSGNITGVTRQDPQTVVLSTGGLTEGQTLTVQGLDYSVNFQGLMGRYYDQRSGVLDSKVSQPFGLFSGNEFLRLDSQVNFSWGNGTPTVFPNISGNNERFSIRWTGYIQPSQSGNYEFRLYSDDGVRLDLEGIEIVNDWSRHAPRYSSSSAVQTLNSGQQYAVQMEHFEHTGQAYAQLEWRRDGGSWQNIPSANLNTCVTAPAAPSPTIALRMDESSWDGTVGEVVDSSGNNNNATANGGLSTVDPGHLCRAGDFDGIDDYIESGDIYDVLKDTSSMSFWIKTMQTGNNTGWRAPGVAGIEQSGGSDDIFWGWLDASGRIGISVANDFSTKSTISINDGVYHHIILTRNASTGAYKIYIDGSLNKSGNGPTGVIGNSFSSIGRIEDTGGSPEYFQGSLDEVKVFSSVLSDSDVDTLFTETRICDSLLGCAASFPDALSSHKINGKLDIDNNGITVTSQDNILQFDSIKPPSNSACGGASCLSDPGNPAPTLDFGNFMSTGSNAELEVPEGGSRTLGTSGIDSYKEVKVKKNGTLNVTPDIYTFYIKELKLEEKATFNLRPGDYWIEELKVEKEVTLNVIGTGTARIYTKKEAVFKEKSVINSADASKLLVYGYDKLKFEKNVKAWGAFYAKKDIELGEGGAFTGAITGGNEIKIQKDVSVVYDSSEIGDLDCDGSGGCALGSFTITQPTYGLACPTARSGINIKAMCADGTTVKTDYAGTIDLSSDENSQSDFFLNSSGGSVVSDVVLTGAENGEVEVYLFHKNENHELKVTAADNSASVSSAAATGTDFRTSGFVVNSSPANFVCGGSSTFTITAIGQDTSGGGSCNVLTGFSGNKSLKAWSDINIHPTGFPGADTGLPENITLNGDAIPDALPASANVTATFSSGEATVAVEYLDVGEVLGINFVHDDLPYDGTVPEFSSLTGSTNKFIVFPQAVRTEADSSDAACSSGDGSCSLFVRANGAFSITSKSVCNDDTSVAQSYIGSVGLTHSLIAPLTGGLGTLDINQISIVQSSLGQLTENNQKISEVGVFKIISTPPSYFGEVIPNFESDNIGRLYPDRFEISFTNASFNKSCDSTFTYMDQPFQFLITPNVTIKAVNVDGNKTENYEGDFWKLGTSIQEDSSCSGAGSIIGYCYSDDVAGAAMLSWPDTNQSYGFTTDIGGEVTIAFHTLSTDEFNYKRPTSGLVNPFDADVGLNIDLSDSDLRTGTGKLEHIGFFGDSDPIGGDQNITNDELLRYGRWILENAFGPETDELKIPMSAQYYDGTTFVTNADDSCSVYDAVNMEVTPNLKSSGTTSPTGSGTADSGLAPLADQIVLSAPDVGHDGTADLCLTVEEWLKFDWNGDGLDLTQSCDLTGAGEQHDNPTSTATFGRYRGHDRIIYWREVSN